MKLIILNNYISSNLFFLQVQYGSSLRPKKTPVVPVSYREKIRVGRSEINFF